MATEQPVETPSEEVYAIKEVDASNSGADEFMNADFSKKVVMRTEQLAWSSRRGDLVGKPLYVAGGKLNGAVTVVVKYFPNADFEFHDHPQGEEIFVLDGVFTDERGDHEAGCYLFNPETFTHTPSTKQKGNLILIRLRQYPNIGVRRTEEVVNSNKMEWVVPDFKKRGEGVTEKLMYPLYEDQAEYAPERQWLERWTPESTPEPFVVEDLLEMFIIKGGFTDESGSYSKGDWIRFPKGATWGGKVTTGEEECVFLLKSGGDRYVVPEQFKDSLPDYSAEQ
jgi:anti-sigma factor ChrR (cupin superfamily)